MAVYLQGLALQFYRGIGPDIQKMGPFKDFNFFIGANNSGKSTVLNFIYRFVSPSKPNKIEPLEQYRGAISGTPMMAFGIPLQLFIAAIVAKDPNQQATRQYMNEIKKLSELLVDHEMIWIKSQFPTEGRYPIERQISYLRSDTIEKVRGAFDEHIWNRMWGRLTNRQGGGLKDWIAETLNFMLQAQNVSYPRVSLIPAIRQIGPKAEAFSDYSGRGLIDRLAEIQSPDHDKRPERDLFDRTNSFLQTVTGRDNARIEIPHNREHILVHMDNKVLPLSSLGTGIHEVVMIAAFCTISEEQIVCIEEPELHLHPLLQRKLVDYLKQNTTNQYFIATHSASFIDTPEAAIFHVANDSSQTTIRESVLRRERFAICNDLGTRASDLIQANCVIWVEGPSDRIYIRHWINAVDPTLIEGIHYAIMFYGGRLLNHLSADDDEVNEFIGLQSLNRNLAVVMDSDKKHQRDKINSTKERIRIEFQKGPGIAWVTAGREIENYLEHDILQNAVRKLYSEGYKKPSAGGKFDHALYFERAKRHTRKNGIRDDGIEREIDKVKVAKIVCSGPANLAILDLKLRVNEIVELIRRANT